jgi:hypothetical protein
MWQAALVIDESQAVAERPGDSRRASQIQEE